MTTASLIELRKNAEQEQRQIEARYNWLAGRLAVLDELIATSDQSNNDDGEEDDEEAADGVTVA